MTEGFKPSQNEDEYFARLDADLRRELRENADRERERNLKEDRNSCPRCHVQMKERREGTVVIDQCPKCEGVWLDKGELELLRKGEHGGGFLSRILHPGS